MTPRWRRRLAIPVVLLVAAIACLVPSNPGDVLFGVGWGIFGVMVVFVVGYAFLAIGERGPGARREEQAATSVAFPNESAEYRAARDRLLEQEVELGPRWRRGGGPLPPGGEVREDYRFEGAEGPVRISELFAPGRDALVIYTLRRAGRRAPHRTGADRRPRKTGGAPQSP